MKLSLMWPAIEYFWPRHTYLFAIITLGNLENSFDTIFSVLSIVKPF